MQEGGGGVYSQPGPVPWDAPPPCQPAATCLLVEARVPQPKSLPLLVGKIAGQGQGVCGGNHPLEGD